MTISLVAASLSVMASANLLPVDFASDHVGGFLGWEVGGANVRLLSERGPDGGKVLRFMNNDGVFAFAHMKRRLAWSTVSNLNYILFSACLMTRDGVTGALTHMVFHGLIKVTLFFCAGAYLVQSGKQYIRDLRGAYRSMPVVTVIFAIAGIALTGIPPFAGFLSKWEILSAAMSSGNSWAWCGIGAIILSSVLCSVYLLSPGVQLIFMPQSDAIRLRKPTDPGFLMKFTLIVLILIIIFACVFSVPLIDFFRHAVI